MSGTAHVLEPEGGSLHACCVTAGISSASLVLSTLPAAFPAVAVAATVALGHGPRGMLVSVNWDHTEDPGVTRGLASGPR